MNGLALVQLNNYILKGGANGEMKRFVLSKWKKTLALLGSESVRRHVPETKRMTRDSLYEMLNRYGMVYAKPEIGTFGNGVIRVEAGDGQYRYQAGTTVRTFSEYDAMYREIAGTMRGRSYLVQKGIHLLRHKGRRFDIRVMVQMNPQRRWETTGLIGRVAHPRKIVTNFHNGGMLQPVPVLLAEHMTRNKGKLYVQHLNKLGVKVAKQLQTAYPGIREIGIDVAVDQEHQPWILEVNTCPDPFIFRTLKDKSVFRKVMRYARVWGRFKGKS